MAFIYFVAGTGIEPVSGGYEPPEVPLLYPAIYSEHKTEVVLSRYCTVFFDICNQFQRALKRVQMLDTHERKVEVYS